MRNLLSAGFSRLWKNKVFWLGFAAMFICSVLLMLNAGRMQTANVEYGYSYRLDDFYFNFAPVVGIVCAVFTGLFLGTEYSDGTIRNKLIIGHKRSAVYLSNLTVCFIATLIMESACLIGGLMGIPIMGKWEIGISNVLLFVLIIILMTAALTAICTFVGMVSSNKAATAVISLLLMLGLLILASVIYNSLCEPELMSGVVMTEEGLQMSDPSPNPSYIGGNLRVAYEFILEVLPTGQGILLANLEAANPLRMSLCSVFLAAAVTFGGILIFRRKDLK